MKKTSMLAFMGMALLAVVISVPTAVATPDDFYVYADWNPNVGYTTGVNGYVDTNGYLGDPGAEYIFFTGGPSYGGDHTAYIYRVETAGNPNQHPDNPDAPGPVTTRTFTLVSSYYMGNYSSGHNNAFYVDDTGIYYGAYSGWGGIYHWDFDWTPIGWEVSTPAPGGAQTLARNPTTGDWWVGQTYRDLYKWDGSSWVYQFTHPNLGGNHHDGMEIIQTSTGDSLFISDMTSDEIIQYRLDASGNVIDPPGTPYKTFTYAQTPARSVEGMGFGPNTHIWISGWNSYTIYEIGGGELQKEIGIPVYVDIKPGSWPNPLKLRSMGVLPVAVCGTEDFDVTTIDPETIRLTLAGLEVPPIRWSYEDVATPYTGEPCSGHDLEGDGYLDLSLKFKTQEIIGALGLDAFSDRDVVILTLTGNLKEEHGGTPIQGQDCIVILDP